MSGATFWENRDKNITNQTRGILPNQAVLGERHNLNSS